MSTNPIFLLRPEAALPVDQRVDEVPVSPALPNGLVPFRQSAFSIGLALLAISLALFWGYNLFRDTQQIGNDNLLLALIHYGMAVGYSAFLFVGGFWKYRRDTYADGRPARWVALLLWLVSAYALNREVTVFQASTTWLCGVLGVVGLAMTALAWRESLSVRWQQGLYAGLAVGAWVFGYMTLYVAPLLPFSIPLLLGLGLSVHTFVPLVFFIALSKRLWYDYQRDEHLRLGIWAGLLLPVGVLIWFVSGWDNRMEHIDKARREATLRKTSDLPDWVLVAQQLQPGWITERLLLATQTYDTGFLYSTNWGMNSLTNLDDVRQHDPLVVIAAALHPTDALADVDKLALLSVVAAKRHGTEAKFWTGKHLTTNAVTTQVRVWPSFRMAYTEQTFRIRNTARNATEEALLTLHLPAGSVVSGMSLWVNGREEPARLTTVAKADSAYRQVVNVESRPVARDPSVVYWQEGSRITVRVFPCRAGEDRQVKVGVTSPLAFADGRLTYQPVTVEGPPLATADALVRITVDQPPTDMRTPASFERTGNQLTYEGRYTTDWNLTMTAPALAADPFVLGKKAYRLTPYQPVLEPARFQDVYLDVNGAWTLNEFRTAFQDASRTGARVWVFDDGLRDVTEPMLDALFARVSAQSFSLFPVYRIAHPETALLVTKGVAASPILNDLKGSPYADHFALLTKQTAPIRTLCLNEALSPYLKTLAELRVLTADYGGLDRLQGYLDTKQFTKPADTDTRVVLADAGMVIQETAAPNAGPTESGAPDHLVRLFTYNHLLQKIGRHYFEPKYQTNAFIAEAQRAHVVSPVSSLIVLETAADYDRFGIHKDAAGLSNATLKQDGAVPEPHEWALLGLVLALVAWLMGQKRRQTPRFQ